MNEHYLKLQSILIVDDNEDDYEAVARAFKKVGLSNPVSLCTSGQGAMDFLKPGGTNKADKPVLIMLDLNMPGMDGFQVLQRIRQDAVMRQIPVVIWTTSSNEKDVDACYQLGANAYMQKPAIFDDLVESVRRLRQYWFETALLPS
jgi:two-component system response regulator